MKQFTFKQSRIQKITARGSVTFSRNGIQTRTMMLQSETPVAMLFKNGETHVQIESENVGQF